MQNDNSSIYEASSHSLGVLKVSDVPSHLKLVNSDVQKIESTGLLSQKQDISIKRCFSIVSDH